MPISTHTHIYSTIITILAQDSVSLGVRFRILFVLFWVSRRREKPAKSHTSRKEYLMSSNDNDDNIIGGIVCSSSCMENKLSR